MIFCRKKHRNRFSFFSTSPPIQKLDARYGCQCIRSPHSEFGNLPDGIIEKEAHQYKCEDFIAKLGAALFEQVLVKLSILWSNGLYRI